MKGFIWLIFVLMLSSIAAQCSENQIDINSASSEELDNLTGIGPAKAEAIISSRPFYSVDDLINVNGIGNVTLNKIKQQGLACVSANWSANGTSVNENQQELNETINASIPISQDEQYAEPETTAPQDYINEIQMTASSNNKKPITSETIVLNPKDIKTSGSLWSSDKIPVYGLIAFSIVLAFLFAARRIKNRRTEFG